MEYFTNDDIKIEEWKPELSILQSSNENELANINSNDIIPAENIKCELSETHSNVTIPSINIKIEDQDENTETFGEKLEMQDLQIDPLKIEIDEKISINCDTAKQNESIGTYLKNDYQRQSN